MADSYSVKAILSAKDSGFTSTLKGATSATESLASKLKSGLGFGVLTGIGQQAFSSLISGAKELAGEISASNTAWKTFEGNMKILGKGEKEIDSVKKTLQDYAQTTIYSSSDMASSYAQLAAVGIKSADKLVTGFGGLAGAAEDPAQAMKTLSQQGVQMAAKPKVAWQDFKLMLEQTPAGMAAVAKKMGMTTSELVTAIQNGDVATKDFFAAVQAVGNSDGFTKLATEYKSIGQAMDGLKETAGNKLMPAFDALSKKGISGISKLIDKIGSIDGQKLADKVTAGVDKIQAFFEKCQPYIDAFKEAFSGVGTEVGEAFKAVKDSLGELQGEFGSAENVDGFKGAMQSVANVIKTVANFCTEHSDDIAKLIKLLPKIAVGLAAFKVAKTVAPFVSTFAGGIGKIASKVGGGLVSKLFGTAKATDEVGKKSGASGKKMLQSAQAFALTAVAVFLIAASFALLAQSAIALSNAGGGAIAIMAGLVVALVGLGIGMAFLLKTLAPMGKKMMPVATAMLAMGAAVLLVSTGFALLAFTAISLANSGGAAIAVMFGMVAAIAALMVIAAVLGTALTGAMAGLLAFGACILMVGAGFALMGVAAMLAATALTIIATALPMLAASGTQGATALLALGAALLVFSVGAAAAGIACIALGTGLLLAGAGMLMFGTGALLAATALLIMASVLPTLIAHGTSGAVALAIISAGMIVFAAGAAVAGAAAIVFAAGLVAAAVGVAVLGVALVVLSVGFITLAVSIATVALALATVAGGLALLNLTLPATIQYGAAATMAMMLLSVGLLTLGAGAMVAGAGLLVFSAGLITAAASVIIFGAGMLTASVGMLTMVAALKGVNSSMKSIAGNAKSTEKALKNMSKSISAVKSGLSAIGNIAKSAMNKLTSSLNDSASKVKSAGKKVGTNLTKGLESGLKKAPAVATKATMAVSLRLMAGRAPAYMAGSYIAIGFAQGMLSQLAVIKRAAAQMAAAADKAVRAKAMIHSPSRVAEGLGEYWGEGYEKGLLGMVGNIWDAAENLVAIPQIASPAFVGGYNGELSADYEYSRNARYTIQVPLNIDGREFAKAEAVYMQDELDRKQTRENRKRGKV